MFRNVSIVLIGLLTILVLGCSDNIPSTAPPNGYPIPGGNSIIIPTVQFNSNNPYDSLGLIHNEAVVYALHYLSDSSYFTNADSLMARINEGMKAYFVTEKGWLSSTEADALYDSAMTFIEAHEVELKDINTISNFIGIGYSSRELNYIHRIGSVFALGNATYQIVSDSIAQIEDDIISESWSSGEYRALKVISIAKYSFQLWSSISNQAQDLNGGVPVWTVPQVCGMVAGDITYELYLAGYDDHNMPYWATRPVYKVGLASIWDFCVEVGNGVWSVVQAVGEFFESLWPL